MRTNERSLHGNHYAPTFALFLAGESCSGRMSNSRSFSSSLSTRSSNSPSRFVFGAKRKVLTKSPSAFSANGLLYTHTNGTNLFISVNRAFITNRCLFISLPSALTQCLSDPAGSCGLKDGPYCRVKTRQKYMGKGEKGVP
uniref:Secreted protein n=1 Tax=Ascaris lumbricoides TaxID=6252 RepID=A0A0M3I5D5_ASCLU